jgi:hypothetical protein
MVLKIQTGVRTEQAMALGAYSVKIPVKVIGKPGGSSFRKYLIEN